VAEGAIVGATVLDFNAGEFQAKIGDYDRNAAYLVYCRSGNRSGQAVAIMKELGFTDVIDAGAYVDLAAAGAPTAP
jgi:rhodanese-related sulfurtransferase